MTELTLDAAALAEECSWLAKAKAVTGQAALNAVHLASMPDGLCLRRTDYETFRESVLPGHGGTDAAVLVDPAKLAGLMKGERGGVTFAEILPSGVRIAVGRRTITLRAAAELADFPEWPTFAADAEPAVLGGGQLARALTSVGTDDTLPQLTGVRFEHGVMASTDRFRLTVITYAERGFTALVPGAALRPFASGSDVVTVTRGTLAKGSPAVRLCSGGRSITAHLLDAEFPKWRQLIPESPVTAMIGRAELLGALGDGERVTLTLRADGTMTVCSSDMHGDVEVRQDISALVVVADELPFTVTVNAQRFAECLRATTAGAVKFAGSTSTKPILLSSPGDDDVHLIMPIRMAA